ncbi:hypothetical protein YTPLAS18_12400 [Nitrospira sp.]|nr:hypothetical protein YTPLAS18_12400 [Nitrospira sp.]
MNLEADDQSPDDEMPEGSSDALADRISDRLTGGEETAEAVGTEGDAIEILEEEKVKDEIEIQVDLLQDPDWVVRREAAVTLGEMADERCVEPLAKALRDGDWQVREAAVDALANVGSPAVETLIRMLRVWEVRRAAIQALGKIKDERVLDPLVAQLRIDEFREDATTALTEVGRPAVSRLLAALKDKDEYVRKQAVIVLGRIKDPEAIDALIALLQDGDWYIRLTAAAALEAIHDERGREAIKPLMKDPDLVVRMRVERILAAWKRKKEEVSA